MSLKKISTIIITCLLFISPGLPVSPGVPLIDNPLPAARTSVFQLVALIRLPFTITANMFSEDLPPVPGYTRFATDRDDRDNAAGAKDGKGNSDCGYSLSSQGKDAGFDLKPGNYGGSAVTAAKFLQRGSGTMPLNVMLLWLGFKYIFLLSCLLALLKSTLPWEIQDPCV